MNNTDRAKLLASRRRVSKFALGDTVREPHGSVGVIDKIFADIDAAFDSGEISGNWYEIQSIRPKTPKDGHWYGVILYDKPDGSGGAVLAGEDDLVMVN